MDFRFQRRVACALIVLQMGSVAPLVAQQGPAPSATPGTLKITPLLGDGAINSIASGVVTAPVVEVRDENDRPVEGATVTFSLPAQGPGGFFVNNAVEYRTRTNVSGQATVAGYRANGQAGQFEIRVTAVYQDRRGEVVIRQTNSTGAIALDREPPPKKSSRRKWILISAVTAAAAVAVVLLAGGNDSSTTENGAILTPGPIVIGAPR